MAKLWGGRFTKAINPMVEKFTRSIHIDHKLAKYDVLGSIAHVQILKKSGYLTKAEISKLITGLNAIYATIANDTFKFDPKAEDIHTNIQNLLEKKVGALVLKLHTARSRNDQVVFATRLFCKDQLPKIANEISDLIAAIAFIAQKNKDVIIPGFTHLQHAQPVYLKDFLGVYSQMFNRDKNRLDQIAKSISLTMGSGAISGTPIIAKNYALKASDYLKGKIAFDASFNIHPTANSIDNVSDRDFIVEIIGALSLVAVHLSRMAEDLIIYSTQEFDFLEIDESFCTGSSLMPQKKNPDVLELIRGLSGRLTGNYVNISTMMKGLPLSYNRDMQLDKEPLFDSVETVSMELQVLTGLVKTLTINKSVIVSHLKDESLYATDLVYYLVNKGVPFKVAHTIVGQVVKYSSDHHRLIQSMSNTELNKFSNKLVKKEILKLFDPKVSVESKKSIKRI